MKILLLSPTGSFAAALDSLNLVAPRESAVGVTAVSADSGADLELIALGGAALPPRGRLAAGLGSSVVGRNLRRLTPLDGGRRFAASAGRSSVLRAAAAESDLIVALERDAVLAAWTALRNWSRPEARGVFGLAPARAVLATHRASTRME